MERIKQRLVKAVKKYFDDQGYSRAVIGLSGGVDSTTTIKLLIEALGNENIIGVLMPEIGLTTEVNIQHARQICDRWEIPYYHISINSFVREFSKLPWKQSHVSQINIKPRVRAMILYNLANAQNALVVGTGNKSELMLGYFTKYGDGACDLLPLGDLFKTEIYKLAEHIGVPQAILDKPPSAELYLNQTDENELGAPYEELDKILRKIEEEETEENCIEKGLPPNLVHRIYRTCKNTTHKRELPFIIKAQT